MNNLVSIVIAFFIGAFIGRYFEYVMEIFHKIREDVEDTRDKYRG